MNLDSTCPSEGMARGRALGGEPSAPKAIVVPTALRGSPREMGITPVLSLLVRDEQERRQASQAIYTMVQPDHHYLVRLGVVDHQGTRGVNASYWSLVRRCSDVLGQSPRSVHEFFVREFLPELAHRLMQQDEPLTRLLSAGQFSYLLKQSGIWALSEWGVA